MVLPRSLPGTVVSSAIILGALTLFYCGATLFFFELDLARLESGLEVDPSIPSRLSSDGRSSPGPFLARWRNFEGISATATQTVALDDRIPVSSPQRLRYAADGLSQDPTNGLLWLVYAREVVNSNYGFQNALPALEMSRLVSPHERTQMIERIMFSLVMWQQAPAGQRTRALAELHELRWFLKAPERDAIEHVLRKMPSGQAESARSLVEKALAN